MVTRALENMFMFWIGGLNKRLMDHIALLKSIPNNKQSQESDIFVSFLVNKKFKSNHKTIKMYMYLLLPFRERMVPFFKQT